MKRSLYQTDEHSGRVFHAAMRHFARSSAASKTDILFRRLVDIGLYACLPLFLFVWQIPLTFAATVPPKVVVSIKPIHSLVSGLMDGIAEPELLLEEQQIPWTFTPGPSQVALLRTADLILWSGAELEPGLAKTLGDSNISAAVVEVLSSEDMKVLPARRHDTQKRDAWFWLDSRNMLILLDRLSYMLIDMDPQRKTRYEHNRSRMLSPIADLDRKMEYAYRDVSGKSVFFYHDTHQYFEQAYAMNVAGTLASPPSEPQSLAEGIVTLRLWLRQTTGNCLFTEKYLPQPHLDLLPESQNAQIVELDSLGLSIPAGKDFYIQLIRQNFQQIAGCVKGERFQVDADTSHPARISPHYLLMNQFGQAISDQSFPGQLQLISFGYTSCPDVCPITLNVTGQVMKLLGKDAKHLQPLFISLDPKRDSPQKLKEYAAFFHPKLMALSGSDAMTKRTAQNFRVKYEIVPQDADDKQQYAINHTASHFLLGRQGEFLSKIAYGLPAEEVAEKIRPYLAH